MAALSLFGAAEPYPMAKHDLQIIQGKGPIFVYDVDDRTSSSQSAALEPGEPVKQSASGGNFAIALATGDPEVGTDELLGIVRKKSTETSTVDGKVEVRCVIPGETVLRGKATTAANIDTAAKLLLLMGDWVCIDLTGSGTNGAGNVFTFDEDEGSDPNVHGFKIMGGNTTRGTLDCLCNSPATQAGPIL
jgi:hypothetical protein